jgi:hypothetical protein
MNAEELKDLVRLMLTWAFPRVTIQFEQINDDPFHIGVGVYSVDPSAVRWVEDKILDIDAEICTGTEFAITPLVRDEATTLKYYPEFCSAWKEIHREKASAAVGPLDACPEFSPPGSVEVGPWTPRSHAVVWAQNEELALAA